MILKLADMFDTVNDTPRSEAVLILSFLTGINLISIIGLIESFIGMSLLPNKKIYTMLVLSPIVAFNFLFIFYKNRYEKIESDFLPNWKKEKIKNIFIMVMYIIFTITFFMLSVYYIKHKA